MSLLSSSPTLSGNNQSSTIAEREIDDEYPASRILEPQIQNRRDFLSFLGFLLSREEKNSPVKTVDSSSLGIRELVNGL
jgi:hypothetical protein